MKISELIAELQEVLETSGDVPVVIEPSIEVKGSEYTANIFDITVEDKDDIVALQGAAEPTSIVNLTEELG